MVKSGVEGREERESKEVKEKGKKTKPNTHTHVQTEPKK
jgi:hypothetical protein